MSDYKLICADARKLPLDDESVDCIVTSPPYWGLRDYKCEGQIGLEPTIQGYLAEMSKCLKEMYRVLKKTGTLWLNIGDTYAGSWGSESKTENTTSKIDLDRLENMPARATTAHSREVPRKSLCLIPDRLRLLMVDMGWIIRNRVIWHKPNSMPSSVKDRFSNSYEDVIFAVKKQRYYFDLDAVREPQKYPEDVLRRMRQDKEAGVKPFIKGSDQARHRKSEYAGKFDGMDKKAEDFGSPRARTQRKIGSHHGSSLTDGRATHYEDAQILEHPAGKNPGDVFTINTQSYPDAHYATFPEKLVKKCLMAGCPKEICRKCGKARVRVTKGNFVKVADAKPSQIGDANRDPDKRTDLPANRGYVEHYTLGWTDCKCGAGWRGGLVLDPFAGSGCTGKVALELGLDVILIDKKQEYLDKHCKKRISGAQLPLITP